MKLFVSTFLVLFVVGARAHNFLIENLQFETDSCTGGSCRFDSLEFFTQRMVNEDGFLDVHISSCAYFMSNSLRLKFRGNVTIMQMAIKDSSNMGRYCIDGLLRAAFSIEYSSPLPLNNTITRMRFSALNHTFSMHSVSHNQGFALSAQLEVWYPRLSLKTALSENDCCFANVQRVGYGIVTMLENCPEDCGSHGSPWFNDENVRNLKPQRDPLLMDNPDMTSLLLDSGVLENQTRSASTSKDSGKTGDQNGEENMQTNNPQANAYKLFYIIILCLYLVMVVLIGILLIAFAVWFRNRKRAYEEWKSDIKRKKEKAEEAMNEGKKGGESFGGSKGTEGVLVVSVEKETKSKTSEPEERKAKDKSEVRERGKNERVEKEIPEHTNERKSIKKGKSDARFVHPFVA